MKIQHVMQLFEDALMEISEYGGKSATSMSDEDYGKVKQFLEILINNLQGSSDKNLTLRELNSSLQLLRNESAKDYIFGKSSSIKRSQATSSMRGDEEQRISSFAGPEKKVASVSPERANDTEIVALSLEEMGYITIDRDNETLRANNRPAISRIADIMQVALDQGRMNTPQQVYQNFDQVKDLYSRHSEHRIAPREEEFSGAETIKALTPNVMSFLHQVTRKKKSKDRWHEHLDPNNYSRASRTASFFQYSPQDAAKTLQQMGMATTTNAGFYTLNKDKILNAVKEFKQIAENLLSGATIQDPRNKTGAPGDNERRARETINFVRRNFSNQTWDIAKKHVFELMRNKNQNTRNALEFYLNNRDAAGSNDDSRVSTQIRNVDKTIIGTVIDFAAAKFIIRKMLFDAYAILGNPKSNVPKTFVNPRDVSLAGTVYARGDHRTKARV